jgi:hypothetical protein
VAPRGCGRPRKTAGGEAAQVALPARKRKAPRVGELGEKTADGKPKPDERTVDYLIALGWWTTEAEVVALLTRGESRVQRYAFETAKPAADWLEARLGREPVKKGGLSPGAKAVKAFPDLLYQDVATLQLKWDALTLPTEHGGVGIGFSEEQAREAVRKFPQIVGLGVDKLARGWSMLTATERGLGLSPEEARKCILRSPGVLLYDYDDVMQRVGLLESLGYADARRIVLAEPRVLGYRDEVVKEHAAWWKQTGLDHVKLITASPVLLGACSTTELQAKLDFLSRVAGMSTEELDNAGVLFTRSLDGRLRARYFYALLKGRLARFTSINSMIQVTDAAFLAVLQGGSYTERASELEVKRYQKLVASSAKFAAWRQRQEARLRQRAP